MNRRRLLHLALKITLPVLMGYLAIGIAFGLMLEAVGYNALWALFMSVTIFAGSGQFMGVELLASGVSFAEVAMVTLLINFRHLVYGLSMLEKFRGMGKRKPYMIFSLTDETYALLSGEVGLAPGPDRNRLYFMIAVLDQLYWITGSVIGSAAGALLTFDTTGVEFAMTALFLVLAIEQWKTYPTHLPALLGAGCTLAALLLFGADNMLLPALCVIVLVLLALRTRLEGAASRAPEAAQEQERAAAGEMDNPGGGL